MEVGFYEDQNLRNFEPLKILGESSYPWTVPPLVPAKEDKPLLTKERPWLESPTE